MEDQNMQQEQTPMPKKESKNGPTVAIVIILLIIVIGGIWFWVSDSGIQSEFDDEQTEELNDVSDSDELADIEADLEQDFDGVDEGFDEVDQMMEE